MNCSSEEHTFGTICTFSCLDGHQLISNEMMCNLNGSWSGEVAVCQALPDPSASLIKATEVTLGVAGIVGSSSLFLVYWILKKLRSKANKFELNSTSDIEDPPQAYKSVESLILSQTRQVPPHCSTHALNHQPSNHRHLHVITLQSPAP
ncbi:E-selectin-like [Chanodichthys erythropterus]|uniref:E-selectin-like n=1 Tax=Chanodichthys erythropterus TaxID=933992 RepID=UPI00351DF15F